MFRSSSDTNDRYGWRCCGWRCCADAISILTSHHCNVFCRMCASIGFQKLVVTYWPSSWFKPWSLCGDVCWSWISNASRTFLSNFLSSVFKRVVSSQLNPTLQVFAWEEIPVRSHFLSMIDFWCCWILVLVFIEVSPTYAFPHPHIIYYLLDVLLGFDSATKVKLRSIRKLF